MVFVFRRTTAPFCERGTGGARGALIQVINKEHCL
jgi:hypothetical protein